MQRRVIAGAAATFLVVVVAAGISTAVGVNLATVVLAAGLVGGLVTGALSSESGHVGAGARAGLYGGAAAFVAFVVVGSVQSVLGGDLSILFLGFQTVLIASLVVPLHAVEGAVGAAVGVSVRRLLGIDESDGSSTSMRATANEDSDESDGERGQ